MSVDLFALPPLREALATHGLSADKRLGQHFLLDLNVTAEIARLAELPPDAAVLEVGPGPGGLTRALISHGAAKVVAIERDDRCLPPLAELGEAAPGRLRVIAGDAMRVDEAAEARGAHVVANLPYNVGTALLVRWLTLEEWPPWWASLTLMFQKEVAQRIVAAPGDDAYGRLSVLAQWRTRARLALAVHRSAFVPPPKVMSAVVHLTPIQAPAGVTAAGIGALTAAAFGQRRKMLRQSLKVLPGALEAAVSLGIDLERRAETLAVADYVAMTGVMSK